MEEKKSKVGGVLNAAGQVTLSYVLQTTIGA